MIQLNKSYFFQFAEILLFLTGILSFAAFVGRTGILSIIAIAGLLLAVAIIGLRIKTLADISPLLGFGRLSRSGWFFLLIAVLIGMLMGMIYRDSLVIGLFPARLTRFAILAAMIGATEELFFRGYFQTRIRSYNIVLSIILAAIAHTAYKFLLFSSFRAGIAIDLNDLVIWTLIGGLILGTLKEYSKNTLFPVLAHVVFDIIVYGDRITAPWWIWA